MSTKEKVLRLMGAAMVTLAIAPWLGVSAAGAQPASDPPGFNGTVKIHDDEPEPSPVQKNQPHVCDFHVHGFNFDAASSGTYRIDQHPPTGWATVKAGTWTADADGNWRTEVMVLPDGHYKLYVDQTAPPAPGDMKHKVFWVRCGEETESPSPTESVSETVTETETATESGTPSESESASETETASESGSPSESVSASETETASESGSPSESESASESETATASESGSPTESVSESETATASESGSPTGTESTGGTTSATTTGVGVLPTKIGNTGDTGVLGTKTGVLAATGLNLPIGAALGISFALLLAGGALMVLPGRLAVERNRRH